MEKIEQISEVEMKDALSRSGYFLEFRLIEKLNRKHYEIYPNDVYPDPVTNKSREIDVFALSERRVDSIRDYGITIDIRNRLIIECSNNPQPAVFFKKNHKEKLTIFGKHKYFQRERDFEKNKGGADTEMLTFTTGSKLFHYNIKDRSTQYCSFQQKKGERNGIKEWYSTHPDGLFDVMNKLYDCVTHKKSKYEEYYSTNNSGVFLFLFNPIIVLQNKIYEAFQEENGNVILNQSDYVIFEFNKYDNNESATILIDIMTEDYFERYLELIENDLSELRKIYMQTYNDIITDEITLPNINDC